MRIGLFGGTFDPIHWGHLRSAEEVREAFSLDRVLFVPASEPPLKRKKPATTARQRLAMVRLAIAGNRAFGLSEVELSRPGKSYTIDTLRYFRRALPAKTGLYLMLGLDAFREFASWKDFREIFPLCHLVVTSRPGSGGALSLARMPVAVRRPFCYDPRKKAYHHESSTLLYFFQLTDIAISSSEIRRQLRRGRSIRYLVPSQVERYIK
ncbi:MAG: nicotinate-nucleotide adenylyltransferase, partial [Candidatus Binatia bacterium]